jgi:cyclohexanone monooxygenase
MTTDGLDYDVVVIGAGFAGMYAVHAFRSRGHRVHAYEAGSDVGGTWYWNRYPGARCDVESRSYSYSFDPELLQDWTWSERYPSQPEILDYARHVADRYDLRRDITFGTRVRSAWFDDRATTWTITTDGGDQVRARYCVTAVGCLSATQVPRLPGLDRFRGEVHHTGNWPQRGVDLAGRRVAVIGTGSSGIQAITEIAKQAAHLTVFQRTPNFTLPARNRPWAPSEQAEVKADYAESRARARRSPAGVDQPYPTVSAKEVSEAERAGVFEAKWAEGGTRFMASFRDIGTDLEANAFAAGFVRAKIAEVVDDPAVAERLSPRDYPIGAKRICLDTDYLETFNRPNVELVDLRTDPVAAVTESGVRVGDRDIPLDVIVMATGYDAMTGALLRMDIRGRGGLPLGAKWHDGPQTYLGLATAGFPNLFLITGPGSPSVLAMVIMAIEQHVDWIADCLDHLRHRGLDRVEATEQAEQEWRRHVDDVAATRLYRHANSWYVGANIPGKPRVILPYTGGFGTYSKRCDEVTRAGYAGFRLGRATRRDGVRRL